MRPTPIFFVHQNYSFYLKYSINQARFYNPDCEIKVITDEKFSIQSSIELLEMPHYRHSAIDFKTKYLHLSHLPVEFEYFCFARWFILAEYLRQSNYQYEDVICLDSDVMLYCDFNKKKAELFQDFDLTVSNDIGPQYTWFAKKETLFRFVDFIYNYYTIPEKTIELKIEFNKRNKEGRQDGISDMTLLKLFIENHSLSVYDFALNHEKAFFDNNINCSDGFIIENGLKKTSKIGRTLYVEQIETNNKLIVSALHFQGKSKYKMHRFYNAKSPRLFWSIIIQELYLQLKMAFGKNGKISITKGKRLWHS